MNTVIMLVCCMKWADQLVFKHILNLHIKYHEGKCGKIQKNRKKKNLSIAKLLFLNIAKMSLHFIPTPAITPPPCFISDSVGRHSISAQRK